MWTFAAALTAAVVAALLWVDSTFAAGCWAAGVGFGWCAAASRDWFEDACSGWLSDYD